MRRSKQFVIVALIMGMVAVACSSKKTTTSPSQSTSASSSSGTTAVQPASSITGDGSTFAQPLYAKWGADFNAAQHIQVNYTGTGSSQGIKDIVAKESAGAAVILAGASLRDDFDTAAAGT